MIESSRAAERQVRRRARHSRQIVGSALVLSVLLAGCSAEREPMPDGVGPPIVAELSGTDEQSAERIRELVDEAAKKPRDAKCRAELGMGYEVSGLIDAALGSYRQAVELDPNEPRWSYYEALILAKWKGDIEGALVALDRAIELDGSYAPAHLYRGEWLLDLGREDDAFQAFERAIELEPRVPAGWLGQARIHTKRGQAQEAVRILEALANQYQKPYVYQMLGLAYRQLGDLERAREALAKGQAERRPEWPDPWNSQKAAFVTGFGAGSLIVKELIDGGRYDEAIAHLKPLREERPDDLLLLNDHAVAYRRKGQPREALKLLLEGLELDPGYYPFHANIGHCYADLGDLESAVQHLDRAIEIHPALASAHEFKGIYLMRLRRPADAYAAFEAALSYDARRTAPLLNLAFLEANRGGWDPAEDFLRRAIALDSAIGQSHVLLGWVLAEKGDFTGADEALARAESLEPNSRQLQGIRSRVQQLRTEAQ